MEKVAIRNNLYSKKIIFAIQYSTGLEINLNQQSNG